MTIHNLIKRLCVCLLGLPIIVTLAYPPVQLFAEEPVQTQQDQSAQPSGQRPTGPDADTYHYNQAAGTWENKRYIWDPVTHQARPKDTVDYSYNPATGRWDTTAWKYDPNTDAYQTNTPASRTEPQTPTAGGSDGLSGSSSDPPANTVRSTTDTPAVNGSTPIPNKGSGTFDGFYSASISNALASSAQSGDANVERNTTGGDASSGNTTVISNLFNLLQSSAAPLIAAGKLNTFTSNIDGDVVGDLHIDPAALPTSSLTTTNSLASATRISTNNQITNNLTLDAGTGNASVKNNTTGGNATSGNANAVANLVNVLNSSIASGTSFLGALNINGNLDGDILFPHDVLNKLLASNAPTATITLDDKTSTSLHAKLSDDQSITNTVTANAVSGDATVDHNTSGGSATSGNAVTNITVLNLTGHQIVGNDGLLVFVNVLGKWVGAIVDAPAGSTAAALGGNINKDEVNDANLSLAGNNRSTIDNNINVGAVSGNATVSNNTTGGNARSGNASASANIANIANSSLSLAGWFGILFINVFGTWNGSFGIDTAAGNPALPIAVAASGQGRAPKVFRFTAARPAAIRGNIALANVEAIPSEPVSAIGTNFDQAGQQPDRVLSMATTDHKTGPPLAPVKKDFSMALSAIVLGAILVGVERVLAFRDQRKLKRGQMTVREVIGRS